LGLITKIEEVWSKLKRLISMMRTKGSSTHRIRMAIMTGENFGTKYFILKLGGIF
jgi:hypothetical protein